METTRVDQPQIISFDNNYLIFSQIGTSFLLWIQRSRQFILLEEPAYYVITSYIQSVGIDLIAENCANRYGFSLSYCDSFVADIINSFDILISETPTINSININTLNHSIQFEFKDIYQFGDQTITISSQNNQLRHYFFTLFSHISVPSKLINNLNIELYESNKSLMVKSENEDTESWPIDDVPHFKGAVLGKILNFIHQKTDEDWMLTLHASGVSDGEKSILFSAAAGAGKSTIAALLQAQGYDLLSDDFIAVDQLGFAYRFDTTISVKQSSTQALSTYYPELNGLSPSILANGKSVRFLPPKRAKYRASSFPANVVVFVNYTQEIGCELKEINHNEAVKLLLTEVFVTPNTDSVSRFMVWVNKVKFYILSYSDSDLATLTIKCLFENDK